MSALEDNKKLIDGIKTKDDASFRLFIDQYKDYVVRIAYSFVGNEDDAQDIAQDVFIKVFQTVDGFKGDSKLSTWLYRIVVNNSLNFLRAKRKMSLFERLDNYINDRYYKEEQNSDMSFSDNDISDLELKIETLYNCLDQLSQNQRSAFVMHNIDKLSYKEIADTMELSLSAVESLIHRAKKNLQKKMGRKLKKMNL